MACRQQIAGLVRHLGARLVYQEQEEREEGKGAQQQLQRRSSRRHALEVCGEKKNLLWWPVTKDFIDGAKVAKRDAKVAISAQKSQSMRNQDLNDLCHTARG